MPNTPLVEGSRRAVAESPIQTTREQIQRGLCQVTRPVSCGRWSRIPPTITYGSLPAAASSFPLLVYDHGEQPDNSQTVLSVADGSWRTYQVPELRSFRCLETPQGLVLMADTASFQCWLWNPQTGEKMALPAMDEELPPYCRCLISDTSYSPPDWVSDDVDLRPDSLVLVYNLTRPELLICRIRGGTAWVRQSYDMGLYEVPGEAPTERAAHCMAAVQGIFYFLKASGVVGAFCCFAEDPEPCLKLANLDAPDPKIASYAPQTPAMSYLLESSKELFRVCVFFLRYSLEHIEEVGAYMLDFTEKKWIKVTDIGERAFLLGPSSFAASCSAAEHGLKKGCVYFANDFLRDSNEYHIFDLKEGTRELVRPAQGISALSRRPFWLVPVHSESKIDL